MNVIVAGSRRFTNYRLLCETLAPNAASVTAVISGGARGADQLGETWAHTHQAPCHRFPAEWQRLVAYLGAADIIARLPLCRLHATHQPVVSPRNPFSSPRPRLLACI